MADLSEKEKTIIEMLEAGHVIPDIAKHLGVHRTTVWYWIHKIEDKLGRKLRVPLAKRLRKRVLTPRQRTAVRLYREHGNISEVARHLGIHRTTALKLLRRAEENGAEIVGED